MARGEWGTFGCEEPRHRTFINHAHYFEPNFTASLPTDNQPYLLPVISPGVGDFTRPAGFAYIECIGDGWEAAQVQMRADAEARLASEGLTIYVFIWAKVSTGPFLFGSRGLTLS